MSFASAVGHRDILFITIDTLRYDVAQAAFAAGETPNLAELLGGASWEERHSPGSFTYAAHQAFFAGFLPTPAQPGRHVRSYAADFPGSETSGATTFRFAEADLMGALAARGYHTVCVGGTGFFNRRTALGRVLPDRFAEAHWEPAFAPTARDSCAAQVAWIRHRLAAEADQRRWFLFLNISTVHRPNHVHLAGATTDSLASHRAALRVVDASLAPLVAQLRQRGPWYLFIGSDHGTAYGEDGWHGHRCAHPVVWTVPFAERALW